MSELKKKCLVVILPTNEKSNIYLNEYADSKNKADRLVLGSSISNELTSSVTDLISRGYQPLHLYILSDDEIEKSDWFVRNGKLYNEFKASLTPESTILIRLYPNLDLSEQWREVYISDCKKIIATTDSSLKIKNCDYPKCGGYQNTGQGECGNCLIELPTTSKEFIKRYINAYNSGNTITEVMVEYEEIQYQSVVEKSWVHSKYDDTEIIRYNKLKVNSSNEISITKVKDNYTREEAIKLAELSWNTALETMDDSETFPMGGNTYKHPTFDDFVKQNF